MSAFAQQEIGPFVASHTCPKCKRKSGWTMRWQPVAMPTDTNSIETPTIAIQTAAVYVTITGIPADVKEVIVHQCQCGYMIITRTADAGAQP